MIEIVDNKWKPYIKLHVADIDWDNCKDGKGTVVGTRDFYFDITARVTLEADKDGGTKIHNIVSGSTDYVVEAPEEIIAACDKLITDEQERKAAEAVKYYEETQARVAATAAAMKKDGDK